MTGNDGQAQEPDGLAQAADTDPVHSFQQMVLENPDIKGFLAELALLAAARLSVPGNSIHAGVTVLRRKKPEAVAASDAAARALDELQNGFGDGPCLTALRHRTTILVPDLTAESRWAPYVQTAVDHGVASILAVPLDLAGDAEAVLNLYSGCSHGFSGEDITSAEAFAGQAASSLRLILRITQLSDARNDLSAAMHSRTVIDMAVGAVMAQNRCDRDTAFSILTRASSTRNVKLRDVAATVITSISGEEHITTHFDE
ncbi:MULTISPECIES: GAF and ANTAR domain-containing protein [unclassified Arthrobacter]|uniref:GAF and ANTAR domain-containing protein n=1 Tax=unclassified Arthrobacter TaxID=235627 RepID=UPI001C850898|nr:GAF and ANTAR domain-containing protein [Arthrobacter sp. MAHUQ-56]MBX7442299.1 GAF and ANTAR domain-containing protein [Arthrobacter sp. MAHUQ-56]